MSIKKKLILKQCKNCGKTISKDIGKLCIELCYVCIDNIKNIETKEKMIQEYLGNTKKKKRSRNKKAVKNYEKIATICE